MGTKLKKSGSRENPAAFDYYVDPALLLPVVSEQLDDQLEELYDMSVLALTQLVAGLVRIPIGSKPLPGAVRLDGSRVTPLVATALFCSIEVNQLITEGIEKSLKQAPDSEWSEAVLQLERNLRDCAHAKIQPQAGRINMGELPVNAAEFIVGGALNAIVNFALLGHDLSEAQAPHGGVRELEQSYRLFRWLARNNHDLFGLLQLHMGVLNPGDRSYQFELGDATSSGSREVGLGEEIDHPDWVALAAEAYFLTTDDPDWVALVAEARALAEDPSAEPSAELDEGVDNPDWVALMAEAHALTEDPSVEPSVELYRAAGKVFLKGMNETQLVTTECPIRLALSIFGEAPPLSDQHDSPRGSGILHLLQDFTRSYRRALVLENVRQLIAATNEGVRDFARLRELLGVDERHFAYCRDAATGLGFLLEEEDGGLVPTDRGRSILGTKEQSDEERAQFRDAIAWARLLGPFPLFFGDGQHASCPRPVSGSGRGSSQHDS